MMRSSGSFAISFTAAIIAATPVLLMSFLLKEYSSQPHQVFLKALLELFHPVLLLNAACFMALTSILPTYAIVRLLETGGREPGWVVYGVAGMITGTLVLIIINTLFHIGNTQELWEYLQRSSGNLIVFGIAGFAGGAIFGVVRIRLVEPDYISVSTGRV